jgi:hypothetical protein
MIQKSQLIYSNLHTQYFTLAQEVYKCKTIQYNEIHSTSLLKWYAKPKTKSKKSSSTTSSRKKQKRSATTEQYEFVFPCYVCPNVQQAIAGYEDKVTTPDNKSNNNNAATSLVRYIGFRVSYRDKIQQVPNKHLLPYNYCCTDDDLSGSATSMDAKDINDDPVPITTANNLTADRMKRNRQWNTSLMSIYLKSLQSNQQEFKKSHTNDSMTGDYKLKVEEQLLQIIASSVFEREQEQHVKNNDSPEVDHESSHENDYFPMTSPSELESTTIVSAAAKTKGKKKQPKPVTTVTKLRAGDVIEYWYVLNNKRIPAHFHFACRVI